MTENMSISVNGQSQVPPGFRFHPTEEELLQYYLRKKASGQAIDLDVISEVDVNKLEPWDVEVIRTRSILPEHAQIVQQLLDSGRPLAVIIKVILSNCMRIGMRKTLVFYKGRAPHGQKSDWIRHEYRMDDNTSRITIVSTVDGKATQEEGWGVCRLFKKKILNGRKPNARASITTDITKSTHQRLLIANSCYDDGGSLEHTLECMGSRSTCKEETSETSKSLFMNHIDGFHEDDDRFLNLPSLGSPNSSAENDEQATGYQLVESVGLTNWEALDRFVASQLDGRERMTYPVSGNCFSTDDHELQLPTTYSRD